MIITEFIWGYFNIIPSIVLYIFLLFINNNNKMKRTKPDQTIISLSSKRQSLQQDQLTKVPNAVFQTVDDNHNKSKGLAEFAVPVTWGFALASHTYL